VDYANLKLRGEAKNWWMSRKTHLTTEYGQGVPIPWERFKREFNDHFFPRAQRQQCARDFQDEVRPRTGGCLGKHTSLQSMGKVFLFPGNALKESLTIISSHVHRGSNVQEISKI